MPSLHKDPRGKSPYWYCAYQTADGVRHFRSTKSSDKRQARQICAVWAKTAALGDQLTPDRAREVIAQGVADILMASGKTMPTAKIGDWCKRWLASKELESESRTHERYETSIRRFLAFLGSKANENLDAITADDILKFRDSVAKTLSPASTNKDLKVIRACLGTAQKQDLLVKNVASNVSTLKLKGENTRRAFTLEEVKKVLVKCGEVGGEWSGLVLTAVYTGQRLGDIAQLTWQQVDLESKTISFVTQKTGKRLCLSMATPLLAHILELPSADSPKAYLFPQFAAMAEKHTGTISTKFYDEILAPAGLVVERPKAKAAEDGQGRNAKRKVSELSFHSFRHTLTTWLKSSGASNALAQMIIGHDSEVVSRGYTHLSADDTKDSISKLPDVTK